MTVPAMGPNDVPLRWGRQTLLVCGCCGNGPLIVLDGLYVCPPCDYLDHMEVCF